LAGADDTGPAEELTAATVVETPRRRERQVARDHVAAARLGHFQLLDPIGSGGMGTVYSAYDLGLDRKVAIKLLDPDPDSREHQVRRNQRLLREAQAMAKLSHSNVVPISEVGLEGDRLFIAMEYVAGQTLGKWLEEKRTWREIVDVFVQAGRGLAAAHDAGIIHRDFKPANVLVDSKGHARVTDFGIALVGTTGDTVEPLRGSNPSIDIAVTGTDLTPPSSSTALTEVGTLVGTPAYMSPEQFKHSTVDARSDQFSFCVALYEGLFGKRPFTGRGKEYARQVTRGEVTKPDPKAQVPGWVTAVVMRGLARDPDARFPSMTALVDALARDPGKRRRQLALGGAAVVAVAGAAAAVGWQVHANGGAAERACSGADSLLAGAWDDGVRGALDRAFAATGVPYATTSAQGVEAVLDRYRTEWIAMRTDACRATRVRREQSEHVLDLRVACLDRRLAELRALTGVLSTAADAHAVEKSVEAASKLTPLAGCADTSALLAPGAEPSDPGQRARRAELRAEVDRLAALDHLGHSKDALGPAHALTARARSANDPRVLAEVLGVQSRIEAHADDLKAANASFDETLQLSHDVGDPELFAIATVELAETLSAAGISASREGLGVQRIARAVVDRHRDPALAIRVVVAEARLQSALAHRDLALPLLREAAERCRKELPDDRALLLRIQYELAWSLVHNGQHDAALAEYATLLPAATQMFGALHPLTISIRLDSCEANGWAGDVARASTCWDAAIPDAERVMGKGDRTVLMAFERYGAALTEARKLDRAREVLAAGYDRVPDELWKERWYAAGELARALGRVELARGDYDHAIEHCRRAYEATEEKHRGITDQECVGEAQLARGDAAAALATLAPLEAQTASEMLPGAVAEWRFVYARAVWAASHDGKRARALALQARAELTDKAQVDAFLAKLP
jgi:tetratricopeptide (TPR) repeat protein/predicted Ser/Thr protein kinase